MTEIIKAIILKLVGNLVAGLSGPLGWIAKFAIKPITDLVMEYLSRAVERIKRAGKKKKDEQNEAKYEEALKDGVKESDLNNATDDLLNGK